VIVEADRRAYAAGIRNGMTVGTALSMLPTLKVIPRNFQQEEKITRWVALAALSFSSHVSAALPQSITLEVGHSLRLFGGIEKLMPQLMKSVRSLGIPVWPAAAATPRAAWLAALNNTRLYLRCHDDIAQWLDPLPLARLPPAAAHLHTFELLGLTTVGDLRRLPRRGVRLRFGAALIDILDRSYGDAPDPLTLFQPPTEFAETLQLPARIADANQLLFAINRLVRALCQFLDMRSLGVSLIEVVFTHEVGPRTTLQIGVTSTRHAEHINRVIRERMQHFVLPAAVTDIALHGKVCEQLTGLQASLLPGGSIEPRNVNDVMDRVRARVGAEAIYMMRLHSDHRPEKSYRRIEDNGSSVPRVTQRHLAVTPLPEAYNSRPIWLANTACAIECAPQESGYRLLRGPERIESGWWDGALVQRDYFIAAHSSGGHAWLYRTPAGNWFVHGYFS
jgi:protein ImuB